MQCTEVLFTVQLGFAFNIWNEQVQGVSTTNYIPVCTIYLSALYTCAPFIVCEGVDELNGKSLVGKISTLPL